MAAVLFFPVFVFLGCFVAPSFGQAKNTWPTTVPFWPHYPLRSVQVLDGEWDFTYIDNFTDLMNPNLNPALINTDNTTVVPSVFDNAPPGIMGRRGTAFYRTTFSATPNNPLMLYISACSFYCMVFVDNQYLLDHRAGGYQPFWVNVPESAQSVRELFIVVDNRFNSTTAPTHTGGDFWMFGGITRSVIVHEQPNPLYIRQVETFTRDFYQGIIDVNVVLTGATFGVYEVPLALTWDNSSTPVYLTATLNQNGTAQLIALEVPNPTIWSPANPNLHTLSVALLDDLTSKTVLDQVVVRFGLRSVGVDPATSRFMLNNEIIKLHGYNRHTMWPDTGSALTIFEVQQDLALLLQVGANYVRGAHYPQDQRFLDLCDEYGILVWEEALGPGVEINNLLDPYFMQYQLQAVNEMISASINHPSVIFWAFYNEGPSDNPLSCPGYEACANVIRSRDPTKYVTWASDKKSSDVCLQYADVVSFNDYPGWYFDIHNLSAPAADWNAYAAYVHAKYPGKPFFISETGAAGIYEWQNTTDVYWSQLYQVEIVERDVQTALTNTNISGITIWQFADIKANDQSTQECGPCQYFPDSNNCSYINVNCGRPGGENHKGSVDFWRRLKSVFSVVEQLYHNVTNFDSN